MGDYSLSAVEMKLVPKGPDNSIPFVAWLRQTRGGLEWSQPFSRLNNLLSDALTSDTQERLH